MYVRLAPKNTQLSDIDAGVQKDSLVKKQPVQKQSQITTITTISKYELHILPYTEKSIVVMGDTLDHSNALVRLGGSFNPGLKVGAGWIFAKTREDTVRKYIETGEIEPFTYSKVPPKSDTRIADLFMELKNAFDCNEDYTGESIHDVLTQFEKMYAQK